MAPLIPVSTIIVLLEHIAIAKSFGRINNYKIDPSQELVSLTRAAELASVDMRDLALGQFEGARR